MLWSLDGMPVFVLVEVVVDIVFLRGCWAVHIVIPVAYSVQLVEHRAVGTEEAELLASWQTPVPDLQNTTGLFNSLVMSHCLKVEPKLETNVVLTDISFWRVVNLLLAGYYHHNLVRRNDLVHEHAIYSELEAPPCYEWYVEFYMSNLLVCGRNFLWYFNYNMFLVEIFQNTASPLIFPFLRTFDKLIKAIVSFVKSLSLCVRPSICLRGTTQLPLDGFLWDLLFENFFRKSVENFFVLFKIWLE